MTANDSQELTFRQIRLEWWQFVKRPVYLKQNEEMGLRLRLLFISKLYLVNIGVIIALVPLYWLSQKFTHAEFKIFQNSWAMLLAIVLVAPILEELIFRGILRFNVFLISIWGGLLLGTIGWNLLPLPFSKIAVFIAFLAPAGFYFLIDKRRRFVKLFYKKHFAVLFHVVAFTFGIVHLANYANISNYLAALPLVSFQIVLGYSLGFVRMKFGLRYSILMHTIWNLIATAGFWIPLIRG